MAQETAARPSPMLFFETANAYQRTAALKAGVDLGVFTAIAEGDGTAADVARRVEAAERGVRILCDYLVIAGFLTKDGARYGLTLDSATFLNRRSPAYMGGALGFLNSPLTMGHFDHLTESVRQGGAASSDATVAPEHPIWVYFARGMGPMMMGMAEAVAGMVLGELGARPMRVLDVAAGHGMFGLAVARHNPAARVVGLDWRPVLEVAKENAARMGVADRYETIAGSAFDADLGAAKYDAILVPNFLHHFDEATNTAFLKRMRGALAEGGVVATVEFVPEEDRVNPPAAGAFALTMLAHTPSGDAYPFSALKRMLAGAGLSRNELREVAGMPNRVVISRV